MSRAQLAAVAGCTYYLGPSALLLTEAPCSGRWTFGATPLGWIPPALQPDLSRKGGTPVSVLGRKLQSV